MIMKARKDYTRPTMKVVELKQTGILMASDPAGVSAARSSYVTASEQTWGDEE